MPRTEPIRSWSTLFGAPPNPAAGPPFGKRAPTDSVRRGVELGYRVLDDYVRQGAAAANAFSSPRRAPNASTQDLPKMTERMFQYGSDFAAMWFDAMGLIMSNLNGATSSQAAATPPGPPAAAAPRPSSRLALDLRSHRPAEVRLTLDEPVARERLEIESLRSRKGSAKIDGATIAIPSDALGAIKITVRVPEGVPPGRYTGAIVDKTTNNPRGRLTVVVGK